MLEHLSYFSSLVNPTVRNSENSWVPGGECARDAFSRDLKFVVIVAGEASADLHGSNLVKAMKQLAPGIVFWGVGGKNMEQAGVKILFSSSDMAVVGITEVFRKLRTIARASGRLKHILRSKRPDLLILIDYPDFNIHIARTAKRFQVPVLYYISPQVWAWRRGRVRKIARRIDRMAVILPFEKTFYGKRGVSVDYVGHPLLDALPEEVDKQQVGVELGLEQGYPVVGLLPGSRKEEIRNLLPVMVKSVQILGRRYPKIRCRLSLAPTIEARFVQSFTENSSVEIEVIPGGTYETLGNCHVALVASGTATLETALMGVPMVIAYKVSPFSYWVGRIVVRVPYIGLVNLVAGEEVVPELIQDKVVPDRLAHEALTILEDPGIRENMIKKLKGIKERLGRLGASEATAKIALEMMRNRS
ncbi:MAG: lipid-A-disaccharide synthase [Deltaproteobacteria bacterium]|nr:lipid-A-disaccharide synthase [Deltaproteobacteria bacterium]MBW1909567.1 lipid-A-disaccharide synthase [Deltaproteobacteria bacterium]MBW2033061.1 lipid-A-disaccharide synthase [Deltaproteobacteria bacterium]MBW2114344.1 lipid-A-disaccharide synthase [Deltaproteobacteria bacterium]MBW2358527.1 lipid-A-disaccharide synthase [Deltaproteobacteria bacterium]